MTSLQSYRDKVSDFINSLPDASKLSSSNESTIYRLITLVSCENFDESANKEIDFFSKKYETSQKLFEFYDKEGKKSSNKLLSQEGLQIFASLLYLRVLISFNKVSSEIHIAKYINTCSKAFEHILLPEFLNSERNELKRIQDELFNKLPIKNLYNKTLNHHIINEIPKVNWQNYRILPIDILFYEGPIGRAYLEMFYSLRCKPRKIINLVSKLDLITKKKVGWFLPPFLRYNYAASIQSAKIHHWPKFLFRTQKKLCFKIFKQIQDSLKIQQNTLLGTIKLKSLKNYCNEIVTFPINTLKDPELLSFIKKQNESLYLFTGGGIMPKYFFDIKNTKFVHIHPGYLPNIRGADSLLWSLMLAGHPSGTSFFMDAGIDTGDIINSTFLPKINLPKDVSKLDKKMIYRFLYSFIDPWVRSVVLRDTLKSTNYFENIDKYPQKIEDGNTFHFMQENMINKVIKRFLY